MLFKFSRAPIAVLNGENPTSFTTELKWLKSVTEASTCDSNMPVSSNSLTFNRA